MAVRTEEKPNLFRPAPSGCNLGYFINKESGSSTRIRGSLNDLTDRVDFVFNVCGDPDGVSPLAINALNSISESARPELLIRLEVPGPDRVYDKEGILGLLCQGK